MTNADNNSSFPVHGGKSGRSFYYDWEDGVRSPYMGVNLSKFDEMCRLYKFVPRTWG